MTLDSPPISVAPASVPQMLPTPPTTTVMKLCTMYCWPISDVTCAKRPMATPAMPAMPDPRPKVIMAMRSGLMPMLAAMPGFWVTARTSSPKRVRFMMNRNSARNSSASTKIATRIELMPITSLMVIDPSSQAGAVRGRACVPKMFLASCCGAMDTPNVASSVSSGRCARCRITSRYSTTPASAVTAKASGSATTSDRVRSAMTVWTV